MPFGLCTSFTVFPKAFFLYGILGQNAILAPGYVVLWAAVACSMSVIAFCDLLKSPQIEIIVIHFRYLIIYLTIAIAVLLALSLLIELTVWLMTEQKQQNQQKNEVATVTKKAKKAKKGRGKK